MNPRPAAAAPRTTPRAALRAARAERGWSQSDAARELRAIALARGGPEVSEVSLKTQLSRWENGHAVPEAPQRALLTELYERTAQELDLLPPAERTDASGADRLRGAVAAAGAVEATALALWQQQLESARRLDDDLGDSGAGRLTRAQVEQLHTTLEHTVPRARRTVVARLLAMAAELAGVQSLDRGEPEEAWAHNELVHAAGLQAGSATASLVAAAGRAAVLREVGAAEQAVVMLEAELADDPGSGPPARAHVRGVAELALVRAALGTARPALEALDEARRILGGPGVADIAVPTGPGILIDAAAFGHPGRAGSGSVQAAEVDEALERPDEFLSELVEQAWEAWPGFDVIELTWRRGQVLTLLREPEAVAVLEAALAGHPRQARVRAEIHAELSIALHGTGRLQDAARHGRAAREIAERIGSRRILSRLAVERAP